MSVIASMLLAAVLSPSCQIVVGENDGSGVVSALRVAAGTMADAFKEATGTRPAVVSASKRQIGAQSIFIGEEFARAASLMPEDLNGMENVVAEKDGDIYLFGRDRVGAGARRPAGWWNCVLPSVRAVTRFMEKWMDVRFLMPGDTGTDVAPFESVMVEDGCFSREKPALKWGNGRLHTMMYDFANNIFGNGAYHTYGGHTYPDACPPEKYYASHPEYFALRSGKRVGVKNNPALCISNPAVEELVVAEILRRFDAGADVVELGQNDGTEYCQCGNCARLGRGLGFGEQFWIFHRRVAERLNSLRPDKTVMIIAYGPTASPPRTFSSFPPNTMVELMNYSEENFAKWAKIGVPRGYGVYTYIWGEYQRPGITAKRSFSYVADVARRFISSGVKGIYRCGFGELFGTEGAAYYVFNRLLENPDDSPVRLVDEYCRRAYGPAAAPMKAFFRKLDGRLEGFAAMDAKKVASRNPVDVLAYIYSPDTVAALDASLTAAERLADTPKRRRRIALARLEFDYARRLGRICHLYNAYRVNPTAEAFAPLADAVLERNTAVDSLYNEKGRVKPFPQWPEVWVLGNFGKDKMRVNGRLGATLGAPFNWDIAFMRERGVLPGASKKSMKVKGAAGKPTLADFAADAGAWAGIEWQNVGGIQLGKVSDTTRFKALYDDEALYFGVETTIPDDKTYARQGHDASCWTDDCIDVLIDPTGCGERYYHFITNPVDDSRYDAACGLITDTLDPKFGKLDASWNGEWSVEHSRSRGKWRMIFRVPYSTLKARRPHVGEVWSWNVGRENPDLKRATVELSLWNPNMESNSFESSDAFGKAVFE